MDVYSRLLQESEQVPRVQGIAPTDILGLPDQLVGLLRMLMREGPVTATVLSTHLGVTVQEANHLGDRLVAKGYLLFEPNDEGGGRLYRVCYARTRRQDIPSQLL